MRVAVRNWLVRGLILAGVAALAAVGWVANSWISPERVRAQVVATLDEQFDGIEVHVGSARMRLLGGIAVRDLKLVRRGDPPDQPFFSAPVAVLYHDKEQLNRGRLVIRKVELENPDVRLERTADGRWSLAEILRPGPADRPVPTFSARGATLTITDQSPGGLPPLRLTDARFTLMNDPLPVLTVTAEAAAQGYGSVTVRARLNRITRHTSVWLDLPEFPLGDAASAAARLAPDLVTQPGKLTATAAVKAELSYAPDATPAWRHDVRMEVKGGRYEHPDLPWPVEKIAARLRCVDGRLKVEEATGRIGPAQVRVALETRPDAGHVSAPGPAGPGADTLARVEDRVQRLDLTVSGVPLDDALFAGLGEAGARVKKAFSPTGTAEVVYKFAREAAGWKRECEVRPQAVGLTYEKFRYPVTEVQGSVRRTVTHAGGANTLVDLRGKVAGQPVTVKGQVYGDGPDPAVNLRVAGTNVPLDDGLIAAFPGKYPALIREFRATGRADFVAEIVRRPGADRFENEFRVEIRDATVNYSQFPYQFEKVKGRVIVRVTGPAPPGDTTPDRDEIILDGFTGVHAGAPVWLRGSKRPVPGGRDRKLVLQIGGNGCPADADLKSALAALKLDDLWTAFSPRGALTFAADVEILDRAAHPARPDDEPTFDPAADLKLTFNFYGPTVTPTFFPYELTDLSGWLEYKSGRVDLMHLAGRHGESRLKLSAGEVRFYPDGVVWANLGGLEVRPLVADAALLKAFPARLRSAFDELKLRGETDLVVKHMVVLTPPAAPTTTVPPPELIPITPAATGPGILPPKKPGDDGPALPAAPEKGPGAPGAEGAGTTARGQEPVALAVPPPAVLRPLSPTPETTRPDPVVYWDAELKLAGASVEAGVPWEDVFGAVGCRGRYEGTHLGLVLGNVWLDRATVARQPVTGIKAHVRSAPQQPEPGKPGQFQPPVLVFTDLSGRLFEGVVGGAARVVLADPVGYGLWLTAADVQLEKVAGHYKLDKFGSDSDLKGLAQAQLWVYNRPDPRTGRWVVEGSGKVDVPAGRMYNLPVLFDLVKVLKLQAPDKTAFEEGHATFRLQGDRVKVDQIDLIGKAVCVGGSGEVDSTGEYVRFEFYMLGSEILARLVNTPVGDLSAFLSRNLFVKIKMSRENGVLKYKPEPVPVVTEPIKAITDRLRTGAARIMGK